jgi:hypothetical protein
MKSIITILAIVLFSCSASKKTTKNKPVEWHGNDCHWVLDMPVDSVFKLIGNEKLDTTNNQIVSADTIQYHTYSTLGSPVYFLGSQQKDSIIRTDTVKCFIEYYTKEGAQLKPCTAIYSVTKGVVPCENTNRLYAIAMICYGDIKTIDKILIDGKEFDKAKRYTLISKSEIVE